MTTSANTLLYLKEPPLGSIAYYAIRFAPAEQQIPLTALYTLKQELDSLLTLSDPNLANIKLAWWQAEIDKFFQGKAEHPTLIALNAQRHLITPAACHKLCDLVAMDLDQNRYQTFKELQEYLGLYGQSYFYIMAQLTGLINSQNYAEIGPIVAMLGEAIYLLERLQKIGLDASHGYVYMPLDLLKKYELKPAQILHYEQSKQVVALAQELANIAKTQIKQAIKQLSPLPKPQRTVCLFMAKASLKLLKALEKDKWQVLSHQIEVNPLKLVWLAWCNARF